MLGVFGFLDLKKEFFKVLKAKGFSGAWWMLTWGWYEELASDQTLRGTRGAPLEAGKADMPNQQFLPVQDWYS